MRRIILITGASRGIGLGTAKRIADLGHYPILAMRDRKSVSDRDGRFGPEQCIRLDVTDAESVVSAERDISKRFGRLDGLVNNAAIFLGHDPLSFPEEQSLQLFQTNLFGQWRVTLSFLELLSRATEPCIVNVSSHTASIGATASGQPIPGNAELRVGYCCAKAALNMLTVQLQAAFDRSPVHRHIRVNAISPGYTATSMNDFKGDLTVDEAAHTIAAAAVLGVGGPRGAFLDKTGEIAW